MYIEDEDFQHKKRALWPFLRRIFQHSFSHPRLVTALLVSTGIAAGAEAIAPVLWLNYLDHWVTPVVEQYQAGQATSTDGLWDYGLLYLLLFTVQVAGIAGFIVAAGRLSERVIYDLRNLMFERLQNLSFSFFDRSAIGYLSIRLTADVDKVSRVISWGLVDLIFGIMTIFVSLISMFIFNWKLSLIVMLTIPLLLLLAIRIRVRLLKYSRRARKNYSRMAAYLTEHINGLEVNKSTVQEERASEGFREVSERLRFAAFRSSFYSSMYNPVVVITGSIAAALVIYLGGDMALTAGTGVTIGVLAAFFGYARLIFEPIFDITRYYAIAQDSLSAGERIFSLIDEDIEIYDRPGVTDFDQIRGDIRFDKLDFYYNENKPILQKFNLHIPAGQSVAIVGPTGSGKTTISSLICRFYEPIGGKILIDEQDYLDRSLHSFRAQLGVILQTPHLFSGTIRENLQYGKLDATDEEIIHALEMIGADEFTTRLDENVGEEGRNLSAGEKQLISFARAILKDPRILIMDEATSSIDTLAELKIQHGIQQVIQGRTSIIIAHRLSTIRNCDRILVIQQGRIIEDGSHEELIKEQGHYYDLYTKQARVQTV